MGTIQHNAIIACVFNDEHIEKIKQWISGLDPGEQERFLWGPRVTNMYIPLVLVPDGSKEGWEESDRWDEIRDDFVELLRNGLPYENDWAEVTFGELNTFVVRSSGD